MIENTPNKTVESVEAKKINLKDAGSYQIDARVRVFKVEKHIVEQNKNKLWINTDFQTDFQKDELRARKFSIMVQSSGAFGMELEITEEMLEGMLLHIKQEKNKVYCMGDTT